MQRHPNNARPRSESKTAPGTKASNRKSSERAAGRSEGGAWKASIIGFVAAATVAGGIASFVGGSAMGCGASDEDGTGLDTPLPARETAAPAPEDSAATPKPEASAENPTQVAEAPEEEPDPRAPPEPWDGPFLGAQAFQTPVYPEPRFSDRIGYIRKGGKVPVHKDKIEKSNCKKGWYKLVDGGYVCGKYSTTDLEHASVRLGITPPDLETTVPYKYAYNRKHGTPLYKSVPSKEDMLKYEPYLDESKKAKAKAEAEQEDVAEESDSASAKAKHTPEETAEKDDGPAKSKSAKKPPPSDFLAELDAADEEELAEEEPAKPWWEQANQSGEKVNITLAELESEADSNLAKRMVKGFFIAVDKSFGWNGRLWYKTTSGLIAPADRMYINKPPDAKGMHFPEGVDQIGFVRAAKAWKYKIDGGKVKQGDKVERFTAVGLTGKVETVDGADYRETTEGWWLKESQATWTDPGRRPSDVGEKERWVDVNLKRRTLVAFDGDKPFYAAMISPGKSSRNRKKDHATPTGKWRIREKHVAVTMDGDGAAGDLPYSIEDVPYVAYYKGSYALHGAFWHNNFGYEMSHGCVNLAPKDAKEVFMFTDPILPRGWHAVWATDDKPGSMVVVHE